MLVFGGDPNVVLQPQKILLAVSSWQWISRPMTGSNAEDTGPLIIANIGGVANSGH
jgi:hypothetical protein